MPERKRFFWTDVFPYTSWNPDTLCMNQAFTKVVPLQFWLLWAILYLLSSIRGLLWDSLPTSVSLFWRRKYFVEFHDFVYQAHQAYFNINSVLFVLSDPIFVGFQIFTNMNSSIAPRQHLPQPAQVKGRVELFDFVENAKPVFPRRMLWRHRGQLWHSLKLLFSSNLLLDSSLSIMRQSHMYVFWIGYDRDGHADANRMPIWNVRRLYRAISDICRIMRIDAHRKIYPHGNP